MRRKAHGLQDLAVGDTVCYHAEIGGPVTTCNHQVTHIELRHGQWIAFITGHGGYVAVEALSK